MAKEVLFGVDARTRMLRGVEMDALPPSVLSVIKPAAPADAGLDRSVLSEARIGVDARVVGEVKLKLRIQ